VTTHGGFEQFEILFEAQEEGGYHVWCPALRGCHSEGENKDEARHNIIEAIDLWLECAQEPGHPIPERETIEVTLP
jgi:predicted RNase H-like HicB family nuclease